MYHHEYEKRLLKPNNDDHTDSPSPTGLASPAYYSPTKIGNNSFDRFIPTRAGNNWQVSFSMISENSRSGLVTKKTRENGEGSRDGVVYSCLLKNEILGADIEDVKGQCDERRVLSPLSGKNLFRYMTPTKDRTLLNQSLPYSLSPLSAKSQKLLRSPRKATRKISRIPFKVLDAPELQDDFYLNLVDWSSQNVLSVGLGSCVYLWSACTSQVTRLCDLSSDGNTVTSVAWNERGNLVAVGSHLGYIQVCTFFYFYYSTILLLLQLSHPLGMSN